MYRPRVFNVDDLPTLHEFIVRRAFGTVAAVVSGTIHLAYAPVVLDATAGERGSVRFHLAHSNPVTKIDGARVRLSFLGPDAYVSPDWYETPAMVPTWNYVAVEGEGIARQMDKPTLRQLLVDLSAAQEEKLLLKKPWTIGKVPEERIAAMMNIIEGFTVEFETLEGKFKLSQDKIPEDFEGVATALEARSDAASAAVATAMRKARG